MRKIAFALMLLPFVAAPASAGCELAVGPCSTDSAGNTYRTEQNLGGSYNTYRNGNLYSQTDQTLSGSWSERRVDGEQRFHNTNPYDQPHPKREWGGFYDN